MCKVCQKMDKLAEAHPDEVNAALANGAEKLGDLTLGVDSPDALKAAIALLSDEELVDMVLFMNTESKFQACVRAAIKETGRLRTDGAGVGGTRFLPPELN